jgi:hypothetical protein
MESSPDQFVTKLDVHKSLQPAATQPVKLNH